MSKAKWKFKEREFARAIRAAQKAGVANFTARVTPAGAIEIETRTTEPTALAADTNEWDDAP
jgi:hypothetical protein